MRPHASHRRHQISPSLTRPSCLHPLPSDKPQPPLPAAREARQPCQLPRTPDTSPSTGGAHGTPGTSPSTGGCPLGHQAQGQALDWPRGHWEEPRGTPGSSVWDGEQDKWGATVGTGDARGPCDCPAGQCHPRERCQPRWAMSPWWETPSRWVMPPRWEMPLQCRSSGQPRYQEPSPRLLHPPHVS